MVTRKRASLSDEDIVAKVDGKVRSCVGWHDSRLSKERERVLRYYNSQLPKQAHAGSSSYVSTDVYDSVERMKAQLLETFAGNQDDLISFPPQGEDDIASSEQATAYCSFVIHRENNGYKLFNDWIHDGLTARVGILKPFWDDKVEHVDEEFTGLAEADVHALAAQDDIDELDAESDETGMFSGTLKRRYDRSRVNIVAVPPEEFGVSPNATSIKDADACYHRTLKSKSDLIKDGYDKKKVEGLQPEDTKTLDSGETEARESPVSSSVGIDSAIQEEQEKVWLYEAYTKLDLRDGKGTKLYKIVYAGTVLLEEPREVYCAPFIEFVPLPVPHCFYGNNFAARVIPTQNARTVLTRAILDHASVTTNPRWTVVQGGLLNPKEMLENRLGGLVNIKRPDAIRALEQANLNPFVFQTLEMLKANKEESTGISSLSQGLNKDAVSTQNSQGLIQDLVTLSQQRQKIVARNFADAVVRLYLEVYRLVLENESKEKVVEIAGNWTPISVDKWCERTTCKVSVNLGYGDRERETQKYVATHQLLLSTAGPMYTPDNQYALLTDGMKSAGFKRSYLTHPSKVEPPKPDPIKTMEAEAKRDQARAAMLTAQAAMKKVDNTAAFDAVSAEVEETKMHIDTIDKTRTADRQDADVANRIEISQREMALAESMPQGADNKSIISPAG